MASTGGRKGTLHKAVRHHRVPHQLVWKLPSACPRPLHCQVCQDPGQGRDNKHQEASNAAPDRWGWLPLGGRSSVAGTHVSCHAPPLRRSRRSRPRLPSGSCSSRCIDKGCPSVPVRSHFDRGAAAPPGAWRPPSQSQACSTRTERHHPGQRQPARGEDCPLVSKPSMVTICAWCALGAGTRHAMTASPSRKTVQAPHSPSAQPSLVPGSSASSRRSRRRDLACAGDNTYAFPLMLVSIGLPASWAVALSFAATAAPEPRSRIGDSGKSAASVPSRIARNARARDHTDHLTAIRGAAPKIIDWAAGIPGEDCGLLDSPLVQVPALQVQLGLCCTNDRWRD